MVKKRGRSMYVFAAAMRGNATTATFTVPGLQNATATALGESRQLTVTNGQFSDSFSGYGVHLYQITAPRPAAPTNFRIAPTN
jgi:hypothetical protein